MRTAQSVKKDNEFTRAVDDVEPHKIDITEKDEKHARPLGNNPDQFGRVVAQDEYCVWISQGVEGKTFLNVKTKVKVNPRPGESFDEAMDRANRSCVLQNRAVQTILGEENI